MTETMTLLPTYECPSSWMKMSEWKPWYRSTSSVPLSAMVKAG